MNPCFSFMKCGNKQQELALKEARSEVAAHEQSIQEGDELKHLLCRTISADSGTSPDKFKRQLSRTSSADSFSPGTSPGLRKSNQKAAMALGHYGFPDIYQQEEKKHEPYEKRRISGSGLGRL
mmetsp:Transcript_114927/g.371546  ORF Transcript_114927/g.371546 Transcript_114927/m.371546 type:complete len:123 (-) Transcript_114927:106-474(-)